jgi:hypothetical protein
MRKGLIVGYGFALVISFGMQSCQDDPITPNGNGNEIDTTWVNDTTGGGNGGGTPIDSTWNGGGNGGGTPIDSTWNGGGNGGGTPIDSTWNGGGNPMDTLGGN